MSIRARYVCISIVPWHCAYPVDAAIVAVLHFYLCHYFQCFHRHHKTYKTRCIVLSFWNMWKRRHWCWALCFPRLQWDCQEPASLCCAQCAMFSAVSLEEIVFFLQVRKERVMNSIIHMCIVLIIHWFVKWKKQLCPETPLCELESQQGTNLYSQWNRAFCLWPGWLKYWTTRGNVFLLPLFDVCIENRSVLSQWMTLLGWMHGDTGPLHAPCSTIVSGRIIILLGGKSCMYWHVAIHTTKSVMAACKCDIFVQLKRLKSHQLH